jgi:osmotically-inducible protein OsmY
VRAALNSHADVTKQTIAVSVTGGLVKLSGNVGDQWERVTAKDVALSVRGVRDVQNLLTIDLLDRMADWKLEQDIEEAFFHTRGLKDAKINVAVTGGAVVLSGEVSKLSQKEMAERVVQRFRLIDFYNEIVVKGR